MENLKHRAINVIARDIQKVWGSKLYFGARPYLCAMLSLRDINDSYGMDSAKSIIVYFLANASTFRGPEAKGLKLELKKIAGIK
jgi:hypothetical protein